MDGGQAIVSRLLATPGYDWNKLIMKYTVQRSIRIAPPLVSLISAAHPTAAALAQSGSAGGSIGNDEKSLSGSREKPRAVESSKPARRAKPESDEPRRASRQKRR